MAWRVLPNNHDGNCAWFGAAQLLGLQGNEYDNMMRLRRECAEDVRKMSTDQLAFAAYTYSAAYQDPTTRHEVRWMAPFAGMNLSDQLIDGEFRGVLSRAIQTPGNTFWGDHFTLDLISNRYSILFLTVRSETNNITIMPSRFSDNFSGDLDGVRIGFLLAQGTAAFDAICYLSADDCIASITQQALERHPELADIVYSVLARPKQDIQFPVPLNQLLVKPRFRGRAKSEPPSYEESNELNALSAKMAAMNVTSEKRSKSVEEEVSSSVVQRVRNPETNRCIIVNGPTWRKHRQMYGDKVLSYERC